MSEIYLSEINIYPLKSGGGIALKSARIDERGFRNDRRWMLVDAENNFITQRKFPELARITSSIRDNNLVLKTPGRASLQISFPPEEKKLVPVKIWNDTCRAYDCGQNAGEWFSEFLNVKVRLVYFGDESDRKIDEKYRLNHFSVSFSDGFPFLLISQASLNDLNSRLEKEVPMNRFRPNLVVAGCEPFSEDNWKKIKIGAVLFNVVKPCARCVITTVDQSSGLKGREPLRTLASFRKKEGKILFGQNLIHQNLGQLRLGDPVEVTE